MVDDLKPKKSRQKSSSLTPVTCRIMEACEDIVMESPSLIEYQHGLLCQIALPRSKPRDREFIREYKDGCVKMQAGELWDGLKLVPQPLPYGPKARLVMIHINSEAIKTRNPEIYCEESGRKFMERLGLNTDGGKDYNLFKAQMKAWAACRMILGFNTRNGSAVTVDTKPVKRFEAWLQQSEGQQVMWPGVITLSSDYFEDLLKHAVPLDTRAVHALAHSALALDAYSFLARRLHDLKKPIRVTWQQFHEQFGQEYTGQDAVKDFRKEWVPAVLAALTVYPSARVEKIQGGLMLHPSPPPIHPTSVAVSHGLADKVRASLPATPAPDVPEPVQSVQGTHLKPRTIETFRARYPRLDPYACKAAFDYWQDDLAPENQARHYDRAFLGFAKKWAEDKQ